MTTLSPTVSAALTVMAARHRAVARSSQLLVNLSVFARSASMTIDVDVTAAAWDACGAPEASLRWPGSDDLALDLLSSVRAAAARSGPDGMASATLDFSYLVSSAPAVAALSFRVGPDDDGEPIATITLREECWPPAPLVTEAL